MTVQNDFMMQRTGTFPPDPGNHEILNPPPNASPGCADPKLFLLYVLYNRVLDGLVLKKNQQQKTISN